MQKIVLQHWWNCLVILIKNEIYFLRAYSAVLKVMDCSIIWWIFFHRFYFNYFFGVAGRFNIQHPSSTFNSDSHSDQLFSSHLIRVTTLAPTPQTMKMRCPNIFAISPINSPSRHHMLYVWSNHLSLPLLYDILFPLMLASSFLSSYIKVLTVQRKWFSINVFVGVLSVLSWIFSWS